ncbi:P2 phage tail completion protein R (GpR) [compost metagenome]
MRKPAELRDYLTRASAFLTNDPDKLHVFVDQGSVVATGRPTYSHEYRYVLNLVIQDYNGHADAIMLPLLSWLRGNQSELFENPEKRDSAIAFEVEFLSHDTIDLSIKLPLTERVIATIAPDSGHVHVKHAAEPTHPDLPADPSEPERSVYMDGAQIAVLPYAGWTPAT